MALIAATARCQHGLVSKQQVYELGGTKHTIHAQLASGAWRQVHPGVYLVGGAPDTPHQRLMAACLAAGPDAVASHRAAAWLWGFEGFERPGPVEITFCEGRGPLPAGTIRHRTRRFDAADRTVHDGIPVTTRERTLLDLGAVVRPFLVETAIESYVRAGGTTTKLERRMEAVGGRGCRGVGVARAILEGRPAGPPQASTLEVRFRRLLDRYGIEPPVWQYLLDLGDGSSISLDCAWPHHKAAVDLHGFKHHRTARAFERDCDRPHELELMGWRYKAFSSKQVIHREGLVLAALGSAIPELVR